MCFTDTLYCDWESTDGCAVAAFAVLSLSGEEMYGPSASDTVAKGRWPELRVRFRLDELPDPNRLTLDDGAVPLRFRDDMDDKDVFLPSETGWKTGALLLEFR